jgi:MFS family permease
MTNLQRRRLAVLGAAALLFALFDAPGGQLQNQYLRTQRHWTATRISVAEQIAGTIGGLGTIVGGRLADTRGRKPVAVVAIGLGTIATLVQYFTHGPSLYVWMTAGSFLGYAVVPALAVYGAELFPSSLRGRAGGILTILAAAGSLIGLGATGLLADAIGTIGPALAVMAIGPLLVIVLIATAYPETAGRRLEDLNPVEPAAPTERGIR